MHRFSPLLPVLAALLLALGLASVVPDGGASGSTAATTTAYTAVPPTRILDTRTTHAVAAHGTVALPVAGTSAVPAGASAVAMTVTVTAPIAPGNITAWPAGQSRPNASNLNFEPGDTVPNLVVVPIGTGGRVELYNASAGTVQLIADVAGYFNGSPSPAQGSYGPVLPVRRLDTRTTHAVAANGTVSFAVTGSGVPSDAAAVVVNLTVTAPGAAGSAAGFATGGSAPVVSNLNWVRGQTVANLAVVPVGSGGRVTIINRSAGSAHFVADVAGYFAAGDPIAVGALGSLRPARLLDTRKTHALAPGATLSLPVAGRAGVPLARLRAVVINVTATAPSAPGNLTVYAGGGTLPHASNVNFVAGQTVPDLVIAPIGANGTVAIHNSSSGSVHVIADVSAYLLSAAAPLPGHVSVGRYVRNITGAAGDAKTMSAEGADDATAGSTLVVLHIGAQTTDKAGVRLSATKTDLTYAELVTALQGYLDGFGARSGTTVVVATNNDATYSTSNGTDWTVYAATARGNDWRTKVLDQLRPGTGVTLAGGNDIEAGFYSTVDQALAWEQAFLSAGSRLLYFTGSADGCPTGWGATGTCNYGWTQSQMYALAGGTDPTRIRALPQIYYPAQAVQWADIDEVGGLRIAFAGSLTEHAANCGADCAMTPAEGWAALYHALSTVIPSPSVPGMTDLRID